MTYNFKDNPLPIHISARIRITDTQRKELKEAYYKRRNSIQPSESTGTGGLVVATSYGGINELDNQLGFSNLVFSDLVNSRDSFNINIALKLQTVLDVELVTKQVLLDACKSYIDFIFYKTDD